MKVPVEQFELEMHLRSASRELVVPPKRKVLLFVGRLGFTIERADPRESGEIVISHKPTPELEELYIGLPRPYSQLTHLSTPLDMYGGDSLYVHRSTSDAKGVLVVDEKGRFDHLRTQYFMDEPLSAVLEHDQTLSRHHHAGVRVGEDYAITVADFGSRNGTHVYIPMSGQVLLA